MPLSWEDRIFYRRLFLVFVVVPLIPATLIGIALWNLTTAILIFIFGAMGMFFLLLVLAIFFGVSLK